MVAVGYVLRLTPIPLPVLGVLYVAVAVALLAAGGRYWREAFQPEA
jgi:hypothetical protein